MAQGPTIELRYYPQVDEDTNVFSVIWGLVVAGSTDPISSNPTEAYLDVIDSGKARCSLKLGSGLTWDAATKQITIRFKNSDLSFIKESGQLSYSFYVVWDNTSAQTIREGTVNAVRVA